MSGFSVIADKIRNAWTYCSSGVWEDRRDNFWIRALKTSNLTVRTFLNSNLQNQASALTYQTILALVPALALIFAIGRGFGFQNLLQKELMDYFPSQHKALEMAFSFVDSCLAQASEGIFVGVGIVFLLWTIISLLSNVESVFNGMWGLTSDRSFVRKVTDYLAICVILPVLMVCSGGLQVMMSSMIRHLLPDLFSPMLQAVFDSASVVLSWLFFAGAYILIPNTRVRFVNGLVAGVIAGSAFQILQWLFVTGQMYVAKYNAIYGSFSFLPLMMIWMQLSWVITLVGALICNASQSISSYAFETKTANISIRYRREVCLAILAMIVQRQKAGGAPLTAADISVAYHIPIRLVSTLLERLIKAGLIIRVLPSGQSEEDDPSVLPVLPCLSPERYTVGNVCEVLDTFGSSHFLVDLDSDITPICDTLARMTAARNELGGTLLTDIKLNQTIN